jgi:hypothetical protein
MKRISRKRRFFFYPLVWALILTNCKKQLDINHDPNFPQLSNANPSLVFPVAVLATTSKAGGDLAIAGGMFSQFFTQETSASQYIDIDSYNLPTTDGFVIGTWDILYPYGLKNYKFVTDQSRASGDWNFFLMGTVMAAYTNTLLVDLYDQTPYKASLNGGADLQPKFDDGYLVYTSLLDSIDVALGKDFTASTNTAPGKQDLIFNGDINKWKQFANTLELKMYLRMINAHPDVAQAGVQKLLSSGAVFLSVDAAITNFTDAPGLDNPQYEQDKRSNNIQSNLKASTTFVSWLQQNNDPRIIYFYQVANTSSINQGDYSSGSPAYLAAKVFRDIDHSGATDPVEFISAPESYFLQAEADLRYNGGANVKALYNQGVLAAFAQFGYDGSPFIAPGGKYEWGHEIEGGQKLDSLPQIIRQKWASCAYGCHGIESFFDKNRTGLPATSPVYSNDPTYVPGQLVIVKNSVLGPGQMPKRFVFPYTETTVNSNAPATVPSTTPVWWGK